MSSVRVIRCEAEHPEAVLDRELKQFTAASPPQLLVLVDFSFTEYWRHPVSHVPLVALFHLLRRPDGVRVQMAVGSAVIFDREVPRNVDEAWLRELGLPWFELGQPLALRPVSIPKPWGQEIWYTGIEQRGVATVTDGEREIPLPWLLAIAPQRFCHSLQQQLILLKILDPLPQEVFGDLYFELHREKREVYVVTAVDRRAWPDGVGAIRFGFNPELRAQYGNDREFIDAYRNAVSGYRQLRREIDAALDEIRFRTHIGANDPVDAITLQGWLEQLPAEQRQREHDARAAMEAFTGTLPLRVGDVVKVPQRVPHSLQHGVRTIEFQTPVYERLILSFAQKVLTQKEWDTDAALETLLLDPPAVEPFAVIAAEDGWQLERIVEFDDFEVVRLTLAPGAVRELRPPREYALCMAVGGTVELAEQPLAPDSALLLPPVWRGGRVSNPGTESCALLLAYPRVNYP